MIVYSDKNYEVLSIYPNKDWTGNALYVVEDHTDLYYKIQSMYPYYDFVLNEKGELIDVEETERPPEPPPEPTADDMINAFLEGYNGQS